MIRDRETRKSRIPGKAISVPILVPGCSVTVRTKRLGITEIYTDDLGYGDVGCYGCDGRIRK